MTSPYQGLPPSKFWKTGVSDKTPQSSLSDLYLPKVWLSRQDKIATAGSCFAQHIGRYLREAGFAILDVEPAPSRLPENLHKGYGYGLYSGRYGNIYSARQLLQLAQDAFTGLTGAEDIWEKNGRFFDAIRPSVEPKGFDSVEEALINRKYHLGKVRQLFESMDVLIFTFGLTECWVNRRTGRVYPTAPGTIAGTFDPEIYAFRNFTYNEIRDDFMEFRAKIKARRPNVRFLVTVSPVPLTATASDEHVLVATTYSKSVLRAVSGSLCAECDDVDYVPSYEIIASSWSKGAFYESNLRAVTEEGVATVMRMFLSAQGHLTELATNAGNHSASVAIEPPATIDSRARVEKRRAKRQQKKRARKEQGTSRAETEVCEEVLLEAFGS